MDFTIKTYQQLLKALTNQGYSFQTFSEFLEKPEDKVIMLRHDVDAKKLNSLRFAQIQHQAGIKGTYFFRMVPQSYDEKVIREIAGMGHEIGYHYEEMDMAGSKFTVHSSQLAGQVMLRPSKHEGGAAKGSKFTEEDLIDEAIKIFESNLAQLRKLYPVKTICMHGSPRSPYDNKAIWKKYHYRDYGIIGEPYFDIDFNEVFYITDTGRRWDGDRVSVRDKVNKAGLGSIRETKTAGQSLFPRFHSTHEIIKAAENNVLPEKIMFTFHPQRWTNNPVLWLWELIFQNLKNQVKAYLIRRSNL